MVYIGIDISKSSFVVAYPSTSGYLTKTFPNTTAGGRKFIATLSATEHHCVMEATGNYGFLLLYLLHQSNMTVSLVNPKQIKHFARMMMTVTKTDEKDACMIAMYGEKMNPPIYKMPSQAIICSNRKRPSFVSCVNNSSHRRTCGNRLSYYLIRTKPVCVHWARPLIF